MHALLLGKIAWLLWNLIQFQRQALLSEEFQRGREDGQRGQQCYAQRARLAYIPIHGAGRDLSLHGLINAEDEQWYALPGILWKGYYGWRLLSSVEWIMSCTCVESVGLHGAMF